MHQIDADEASLKATQEASTLSNQQRDEILTEQTERVNTVRLNSDTCDTFDGVHQQTSTRKKQSVRCNRSWRSLRTRQSRFLVH